MVTIREWFSPSMAKEPMEAPVWDLPRLKINFTSFLAILCRKTNKIYDLFVFISRTEYCMKKIMGILQYHLLFENKKKSLFSMDFNYLFRWTLTN